MSPSVPVEIIHIDEVVCTVHCPLPQPSITVELLQEPTGVSVENLVWPPVPPGTDDGPRPQSCTWGAGPATCTIDGRAQGAYSFDVVVPGSRTVHLDVTLRRYAHVPGVCCEPAFVPR